MMNEIDTETKKYLDIVLQSFSPGILFACAYGSGVFKQAGHKSVKDNMIDFIFVVDNASSWHQRILDSYSNHYSFLKYFGASTITSLQNNYGARVYFNTRVNFKGRLIKYGVIELDNFLKDLIQWETLYIAGRLHKPVVPLMMKNSAFSNAINENLQLALNTSLLTLPEKFTEEELYIAIAGLSYAGDLRMIIGEDKGKVKNIVQPNLDKFQALYSDLISENKSLCLQNGIIEQDLGLDVQTGLLGMLPINLRNKVFYPDNLERLFANRTELRYIVMRGVSDIVRVSSTSQTLKSAITAGGKKSVVYGAQKLFKMLKGFAR